MSKTSPTSRSLANYAVELTMPVRLVSLLNAREHWATKAKRARDHREIARLSTRLHTLYAPIAEFIVGGAPLRVTITRIAPRDLDDDNLAGSGKHVRDGIADALGIDDRDPRVKWAYAQERGKPREYACRVRIEVIE
jgi:hypothetical protein